MGLLLRIIDLVNLGMHCSQQCNESLLCQLCGLCSIPETTPQIAFLAFFVLFCICFPAHVDTHVVWIGQGLFKQKLCIGTQSVLVCTIYIFFTFCIIAFLNILAYISNIKNICISNTYCIIGIIGIICISIQKYTILLTFVIAESLIESDEDVSSTHLIWCIIVFLMVKVDLMKNHWRSPCLGVNISQSWKWLCVSLISIFLAAMENAVHYADRATVTAAGPLHIPSKGCGGEEYLCDSA